MDALERLLALEEIRQLKARYFRCVDSKDWVGFEAVFAANAVLDISDDIPDCVIHGAANFVATVRAAMADVTSVHHGHCPEIELVSATEARGIWAMEDMLWWPEGSAAPLRSLHGYGHYHETYQRLQGRWQISSMKLVRLRVDLQAS
jgi:hypothetical protein